MSNNRLAKFASYIDNKIPIPADLAVDEICENPTEYGVGVCQVNRAVGIEPEKGITLAEHTQISADIPSELMAHVSNMFSAVGKVVIFLRRRGRSIDVTASMMELKIRHFYADTLPDEAERKITTDLFMTDLDEIDDKFSKGAINFFRSPILLKYQDSTRKFNVDFSHHIEPIQQGIKSIVRKIEDRIGKEKTLPDDEELETILDGMGAALYLSDSPSHYIIDEIGDKLHVHVFKDGEYLYTDVHGRHKGKWKREKWLELTRGQYWERLRALGAKWS